MGMNAQQRVDPVLALGEGERRSAGVEPEPTVITRPTPAARARAMHLGRRLGTRIEMRVSVDHSAASGDSTRGKSGARRPRSPATGSLARRRPVPGQVLGLAERREDPRRGIRKVRRPARPPARGDRRRDRRGSRRGRPRALVLRELPRCPLLDDGGSARGRPVQIASSASRQVEASIRAATSAPRSSRTPSQRSSPPGVRKRAAPGSARSSRSSARRGCRARSRAHARTAHAAPSIETLPSWPNGGSRSRKNRTGSAP